MTAALVSACGDVPLEGSQPSPSTKTSAKPSTTPGKPSDTPTPTEPDPSKTLTPGVKPPNAAPVTRTFPAKLPNGKPPLFVVVSFDGAGDLTLWSHWRQIAKQVNARMTFFLSGPYLYPGSHRTDYKPAYLAPGSSDIG
jgi:hypothetical protein